MRAIWSGGISFGLLFIPVKLYSAVKSYRLDLDMLTKKDNHPIRYARLDVETGKEIAWEDVVKGFEYQKGDYVVLNEEDLEKASPKTSKAIEIQAFVDQEEIDPKYFEKPYFLEPDKGSEKIYALLRDALKKSGKIGIAEFVLRSRERLCALKPDGDMLILDQMRYEKEMRKPEDLNIPGDIKQDKKEMDLAIELIDKMDSKFHIEDYEDDYLKVVKKIINAKKKNKEVISVGEIDEPIKTEVKDVMDQLKKSLSE